MSSLRHASKWVAATFSEAFASRNTPDNAARWLLCTLNPSLAPKNVVREGFCCCIRTYMHTYMQRLTRNRLEAHGRLCHECRRVYQRKRGRASQFACLFLRVRPAILRTTAVLSLVHSRFELLPCTHRIHLMLAEMLMKPVASSTLKRGQRCTAV